jgi:hypothetical protein
VNATPVVYPYTGAQQGALHSGTLAATVNFPAVPVSASRLSLHLKCPSTGTPTGTFKLQASFDGTNWVDTPNASTEFTSQPAGAYDIVCNWTNLPGTQWRLVYTRTSGSGTLTSYYAMGPS